tara:strand:- start:3600 stop:3989 length:390 start_codon:yes stop_codon:yes gene_type:complete
MSLITELRFRFGGNHTNYTPSRNPDMNVGHSTNYKGISTLQSYGGKVYTNERFGKQLQWEFNYTNLSNADRLKLEALINATSGRKSNFDFSPDAGNTYYSVRFTEGKLSFEQTAYGIYSVSFIILQEVS